MLEQKNKGGRPTTINDRIEQKICYLWATQPKAMSEIVKEYPDLPPFGTIYSWLTQGQKGKKAFERFSERHARATRARAQMLADQILVESRKADPINAHAQRVKIDALKWLAARLDPIIFGDRQQIDLNARVQQIEPEKDAPEWVRARLEDRDRASRDAKLIEAEAERDEATTH